MRRIEESSERYLGPLTDMALDLWPDSDYDELRNEFFEFLQSDKDKVYLYLADDLPVAFIHLCIRFDYVEGSVTSPVGYVEGIYVKPEYRRQGISKALLQKSEEWMKSKGCKQIGSDIEYDNHTSYQFHLGVGFKEANRIICFIKDLE
uniref:Aminoglycoside N(6')-acetyltransferase type 1 n=1 Tax=Cohnella candidum TaxID=2674991 RepID=A0A3G3K5T5_9BACL|nr:GNAT family N-acetyltransferase [Cohnella candidum]